MVHIGSRGNLEVTAGTILVAEVILRLLMVPYWRQR